MRNMADGWETLQPNAAKLPFPEDRLHHFVNCVLDGKKPNVPLEESLTVQIILDAIYASSVSGKEVRL
jgi:predicted dehydrogenase